MLSPMGGARGLLVAFAMLGCTGKAASGGAAGVGESCHDALVVPEGGFQRSEMFVHVGSESCETPYCLVNHYQGDLVDSAVNGDGIPERNADEVIDASDTQPCGEDCGFVGIRDRIYCTCKCGVEAGGDPDSISCSSCPDGFECCPLFGIGEIAGDYCVLEGTCEGAR